VAVPVQESGSMCSACFSLTAMAIQGTKERRAGPMRPSLQSRRLSCYFLSPARSRVRQSESPALWPMRPACRPYPKGEFARKYVRLREARGAVSSRASDRGSGHTQIFDVITRPGNRPPISRCAIGADPGRPSRHRRRCINNGRAVARRIDREACADHQRGEPAHGMAADAPIDVAESLLNAGFLGHSPVRVYVPRLFAWAP
jgi:hypothetical protein